MANVREQTSKSSSHFLSDQRVRLVSVGIGVASFLATEFMHHMLVLDLGRRSERLVAEGVSAVLVTVLIARLMHASNQRREATLLRMQVISEMNFHIRSALAAISLSTEEIQNQQCIRVISESIDRIEWALREILLRPRPVEEKEQARWRHIQRVSSLRSPYAGQENKNE
jgi:hypothetical protein